MGIMFQRFCFLPFKKKQKQKQTKQNKTKHTLYINLTVIEMNSSSCSNNVIMGKQKLAILFLSFFFLLFVCLWLSFDLLLRTLLSQDKEFFVNLLYTRKKHIKKQRVVDDEFPDNVECAPKIDPW